MLGMCGVAKTLQTVWKLGAASAKQRVLPCEPRKVAQFRVKVLVFSFLWKILLLAFEEREFSHSLHADRVETLAPGGRDKFAQH
jgi:hypothetical protein